MAAVFDTNVLISAALFATSKPSLALRHAMANDLILGSTATLTELASTMERAKFDRYATLSVRRRFVALIYATVHVVEIYRTLHILPRSRGRQVSRRRREWWRGRSRQRRC